MSKHMGALRGIVIATLAATACIAFAATPAQEKAFVDNYRKAFETKDAKALQAFLYTKGADPRALEFYKMMLVPDADDKLTSITLVDLTAEDVKKLAGEDARREADENELETNQEAHHQDQLQNGQR